MSTAYQSQLELTSDVAARAPFSTVLKRGSELASGDARSVIR